MKKNLLLVLAIFAFFSSNITAQNKGYLKFEITDFKAANPDDPQAGMMENMIKGTITKLYFEDQKALTKINSMGGMSTMKIVLDKDGNGEMYMEMMGQKIKVNMPKDKMEEAKKTQGDEKPEYVHHKDQTKEILGFKAHFVEVKTKEDKVKMNFWVTDEIKSNAVVSQGIDNTEIGGFPLEYTMEIPGQFSMTTKATEYKKDFDSSVFDFDKTGYKEMDMDELQNMGGGGF